MNIIDLWIHIKLPFLKDRELYHSLREILGFYPHDIRPYKIAMRHRSVAIREEGKRVDNERLEFLGDAILGAVVGHIVFRHFPQKPEGFLTNARSNIVRRQSLNKLAKDTGFDRLIITNFKQKTHNNYVTGNAFEALIGAIYLDRGYGHCVRFVRDKIMAELVNIDKAANEINYKSKLIEWGQRHHVAVEFISEESKENDATPVFFSKVTVAGVECGIGKGYSKKESQQKAACQALERLHQDREFAFSITAPKEQQMQRYEDIAPVSAEEKQNANSEDSDDIDFSDITMRAKSREEIIAEAEAKAFAE